MITNTDKRAMVNQNKTQIANKINSFYISFIFIIFCVFWLLIVLKLGVFDSSTTQKEGVLSFTFNWWENSKINTHLFLGNYQKDELLNGTVYTTYTYPYYFVNYILLSPIHHLFNISYEKAQNILPFINVAFFLYVLFKIKKVEIKDSLSAKNIFKTAWLFLIVGILITNSLPWVSMLRYNQDNFHMFIAIVFCILSVYCINEQQQLRKDRAFLIAGIIIGCLTPIYFPAWLLCYIYAEDELKVRKKMATNVLLVICVHIFNYTLPLLAASSLNLKSSASGYLYRSGLDGSNQYFDTILTALYRPFSEQHTTSSSILIFSVIAMGFLLKNHKKTIFKQFTFLLIPFFTVLILFPQFSSIHMYFIEFLIVIPSVFMLVYWLFTSNSISNISPKKYTLMLLFFCFLIMTQLIEIARSFELLTALKSKFI